MAQGAAGVDDDSGPVGDPAVLKIKPEGASDLTLGVKVSQQRDRDAAQARRPVGVTIDAVDGDAEDLRIGLKELSSQRIQRWYLLASRGREIQGIEDQHHVTLSVELRAREAPAKVIRECEVWRFVTEFDHGRGSWVFGVEDAWTLGEARADRKPPVVSIGL